MDKIIDYIKNKEWFKIFYFLISSSFLKIGVVDGKNKSKFINHKKFSFISIFKIILKLSFSVWATMNIILPMIYPVEMSVMNFLGFKLLIPILLTFVLFSFICGASVFLWAYNQSYSFFVIKFKGKAFPPDLKYYFIKASSIMTFILIITIGFCLLLNPLSTQIQKEYPNFSGFVIVSIALCIGCFYHKYNKVQYLNDSVIYPNTIIRVNAVFIVPISIMFITLFIMTGRIL